MTAATATVVSPIGLRSIFRLDDKRQQADVSVGAPLKKAALVASVAAPEGSVSGLFPREVGLAFGRDLPNLRSNDVTAHTGNRGAGWLAVLSLALILAGIVAVYWNANAYTGTMTPLGLLLFWVAGAWGRRLERRS